MPAPSCKKEVQSFIGMINYLSKFSARLSELALPIRELAKDKVAFNWGPEHQAAFKPLKKEIAATPILAYFDPKKTTVLQTDASINGHGTCLLQDEKPVYFASKALTEAQHWYVAIELEFLAVAWAMEKFHHFLYGNHFLLETDEKPLETILSRSLNQATPRLQRILIRTFPYNFSFHYLSGLKNQLADCLFWVGGLQILSSCPSSASIKLQTSLTQEVTAYNSYEKFHKLTIPLPYLNTQYRRGGQAVKKNYQVRYRHSGHSRKSWPFKMDLYWKVQE